MGDLSSATMLLLNVAVIGALGVALWRFDPDPGGAWEQRETRLKDAVRRLQSLVGEADEQARVIDAQLAGRLEELRALLQTPVVGEDGGTGRLRRQIYDLAASATPLEEIARRVNMPVAEVRLLVGVRAGQGGKNVAAKSAA